MAKSPTVSLARLIGQLQSERQKHVDAISAIDAQFEEFGIAAAAPSKKKRRGGRGPGRPKGSKKKVGKKKRGGKKKVGKKRGKKKSTKKKASKVGKKVVRKKATKKRSTKKKRRTFSKTADEFILDLVKGKSMTTAQINAKWKQAGRGATANNILSKLAKARKLKKEKVKDGRGSSYRRRDSA